MLLFVALIGLAATTHSTNLPATWKTCKLSDPNLGGCLKDAISIALADLMPGNPSLGVMPIDPIHISKFIIKQGTGPVSVNLDLIEVDAKNLKFLKITSFEGDWNMMKMSMDLPNGLEIKGQYKIDGKALTLPIKGEGPCVIKLDKISLRIGIKYSERQIKGKTHYNVDNIDLDFDTERLHLKLDNLFGGDKALSDNTNKFLNENWAPVLKELKQPLIQGLVAILKQMSDAVFSKLTKDQISPP